MPISMIKIWLMAIRPKTLPAAIAPVLIGTAMAFGDGVVHWLSAFCCLLGALLIQIGTNLTNDYFDFKKGADQNRVGPTRVTQAGLVKPHIVLIAAMVVFAIAMILSGYLVLRGGKVLMIIAIASVLSGIFYTAGKRPLGYLGLGELFVFIFFGPVAVSGTYFVQSHEINWAVFVAGFAPGLISCAIIAVNNLRDLEGDRKAQKNTLAVRFGRAFALQEYLALIIAAVFIPFIVQMIAPDHRGVVAASLVVILAIPLMKTVCVTQDPQILNKVLARTGILLMLYAIIFSAGWVLCSR